MTEHTFTFLILGEASTGKTCLINKFVNPDYEVVVTNDEESYFWQSQVKALAAQKTIILNEGKNIVHINLKEVAGSHGRESNYYEISSSASSADCVLFCFTPQDDWKLQSYSHTMGLVDVGRVGEGKSKKGSLFKKGSKKSSELPPIPSFLIQNNSDSEIVGGGEEFAKAKNLTLFKVSASKNENVQSTFEAIAQELLNTKQAKPNKAQEKSKQPKQKNNNNNDSKNSTTIKQDFSNIWDKVMGKFVGKPISEQSKQQENDVEEIAPLA